MVYFKTNLLRGTRVTKYNPTKFTPEFKQEMVDACLSGATPTELSKQYDVSNVSIRNWVKKSGQTVPRMRPEYTLEFKQKIADLCVSGTPSWRLQQEYGVDSHAIKRWVLAFGHEFVPRWKPRSIEFKRKIVDLYFSGITSTQIWKEYGISSENTCRWIKEFGEEARVKSTFLSADGKEKTCFMCKVMQPLENFSLHKIGIGGRLPWCKPCHQIIRRIKTYKLNPEEFTELLESQGGLCAICRRAPGAKGWNIDHDHACCPKGKSCGNCVRGLLCSSCNNGIGQLRDDESVLQSAISYLRKYRENKIIPGNRPEEFQSLCSDPSTLCGETSLPVASQVFL